MTARWARTALSTASAVAVAAAVLGCGVRPTGIVAAGALPAADGRAEAVTLYLVDRDGRLVPVLRPGLPGHPYSALAQLSVPPTMEERRRGLTTKVRPTLRLEPQEPPKADDSPGVLTVQVHLTRRDVELGRVLWSSVAKAQVACTAAAIPGVRRVRLAGLLSGPGTGVVLVTGVLTLDGGRWADLKCER
ncbi:hypothetical protein [Spirillospora sp. NBC_01491]|uniref:hypothetical protein n=1 Tax=Spirillospora sp. NBC_01491 TaxID=2976007 RepID=UPI002E34CDD3|nr:hypothetical protein [Spirillospora sp. NBC_01491]